MIAGITLATGGQAEAIMAISLQAAWKNRRRRRQGLGDSADAGGELRGGGHVDGAIIRPDGGRRSA